MNLGDNARIGDKARMTDFVTGDLNQ